MILDPIPFLQRSLDSTGGWGYRHGHSPSVEPTCAVLLALNKLGQGRGLDQRAVPWLLSLQNEDGGWGLRKGDSNSAWMTAWAVWALAVHVGINNAMDGAVRWLLDLPVLQISNIDDLAMGEKIAGIDFSLRGWPWQPGESSWVEPTAITVLGLVASGNADSHRMDEAARYLANRRCPEGGWNVGNPVMFGSYLPARAQPTAMGILALNSITPGAILDEDFAILEQDAIEDDGPLALAWAGYALAVCGKPAKDILNRLVSKQLTNGSWDDSPYATAVAWMAILETQS